MVNKKYENKNKMMTHENDHIDVDVQMMVCVKMDSGSLKYFLITMEVYPTITRRNSKQHSKKRRIRLSKTHALFSKRVLNTTNKLP